MRKGLTPVSRETNSCVLRKVAPVIAEWASDVRANVCCIYCCMRCGLVCYSVQTIRWPLDQFTRFWKTLACQWITTISSRFLGWRSDFTRRNASSGHVAFNTSETSFFQFFGNVIRLSSALSTPLNWVHQIILLYFTFMLFTSRLILPHATLVFLLCVGRFGSVHLLYRTKVSLALEYRSHLPNEVSSCHLSS